MRFPLGAAAVLALAPPAVAPACEPALDGAPLARLEGTRHVLAFRAEPAEIEPGAHFALVIATCAKAGGELAQLEVDAHMPAHRHGMNYLPSVTTSSAGRHRAEGLMFHMPGRWEFVFVLRAGGAVERLTHAVTLD